MAESSIRVEYNQSLEALTKMLSGVKRSGDFFLSGLVEVPMPKVEVDGVGVLSFPVPPVQVATLIQHATRAPYGRGEETILDESVRKVWQLRPDQVRLSGKSWETNFDSILKQVLAGLGCEGMSVSAELYKLLVYDTGGFFLSHRDTEKADGMFGTLVISLPSAHQGGELVIRHAGREVTVDLSHAEFSELRYAAFYADCEHEVRPITEGNRVCLVYNLIQQGNRKTGALQAPDYEKQIAAAATLLGDNLSAPGAVAKVAWLLEHQYSPDGLSFAGLKSGDAARVKVLAQAAERAGCAVHLGIVHIEESGSAEPKYFGYGSRSRRRGWHGDDEDEADVESGEFEIVEVCDWRHYISQWRNGQDKPVDFGEIPIAPGELLPAGALDDEKPDEQRLMEASGNEGASFERSYHRAALVIWRRERYAEVLLQAGVAAALPYLAEKITATSAKNAPPTARREALALARQMVDAWEAVPEHGYPEPRLPDQRDGMLKLLARLGDSPLLERFIAKVVSRDYDGTDNAALVGCVGRLEATTTGPLFAELFRRHVPIFHGPCVDLLHDLTFKTKLAKNDSGTAALRQIARAVVEALDEVEKRRRDGDWANWHLRQEARPVNAALVANLLSVLGRLDAPELLGAAAEKFAARPEVFDSVKILVPALEMIHLRDATVSRLWEHCAQFLLDRSGHPPEAPKDWRQDVKLSCSCPDCRELQ
ncbi:MAG TPA: 2OG-Fe(II) oxygenase, partial [Verrucomicrobiota bacterium]|nr:2OG-Fe(II) oxygenase [Verrucomicrobiota bacterium]